MTPELFIGINAALFLVGLLLACVVLALAARHGWLIAYGPQQARLRLWLALVLILLVILCASAAVFNLSAGGGI